jgi:ribosome-binding factor A
MGGKGYKRLVAVNELIRQEVSMILLTATTDPRLQRIAITRVDSSSDLQHAKIYYRVIEQRTGEGRKEMEEALQNARGYVQLMLGPRIRTKYTPVIEFYYDDCVEKIEHIEELLKETRDADGQEEG